MNRLIVSHSRAALICVFAGAILPAGWGFAQEKKAKEVAGKADLLKLLPKKFGKLIRVNAEDRKIEVHFEKDQAPTTWSIKPDAEIKVHGWWGRLEQLQAGDRVWAWLEIGRNKRPKRVLMLSDELSEQDIHGMPYEIKSIENEGLKLTVHSKLSGTRHLRLTSGANRSAKTGDKVFLQTAGNTARIVAGSAQMESMRTQQQAWLRDQWRQHGLPGTVTFLHPLGGEMDIILDHEAMRWGRYLKAGNQVTLNSATPIKATVKHVLPWRERTQVRLVTHSGIDQADLVIGERVRVIVPEPPAEVQNSSLPTDIGRSRSKQERQQWFLASIYCPCKVRGDVCTGMFYSLASCNLNSCGMPKHFRSKVGSLIDQGLTDKQIWDKLGALRGPLVYRQHLLR